MFLVEFSWQYIPWQRCHTWKQTSGMRHVWFSSPCQLKWTWGMATTVVQISLNLNMFVHRIGCLLHYKAAYESVPSADSSLARSFQQIQVLVLEREVWERAHSSHPGGLTEKMTCADLAASGGRDFCQVRRLIFQRKIQSPCLLGILLRTGGDAQRHRPPGSPTVCPSWKASSTIGRVSTSLWTCWEARAAYRQESRGGLGAHGHVGPQRDARLWEKRNKQRRSLSQCILIAFKSI